MGFVRGFRTPPALRHITRAGTLHGLCSRERNPCAKIKEVLRLRYELNLDQRQIARSCSIAASTVHEYLKRAERDKVWWPLPDGWNDTHLEAALYPSLETKPQPQKSPPDFAAIHEQLRTHRHLTLQLLWEEYPEANPDGYRYSRFCELYQRWRKKLDVVKSFVACALAQKACRDGYSGLYVRAAALFRPRGTAKTGQ
jgi:hypothetical protein